MVVSILKRKSTLPGKKHPYCQYYERCYHYPPLLLANVPLDLLRTVLHRKKDTDQKKDANRNGYCQSKPPGKKNKDRERNIEDADVIHDPVKSVPHSYNPPKYVCSYYKSNIPEKKDLNADALGQFTLYMSLIMTLL